MNIVLIGYRGSGKTTVGKIIAESLGWAWADSDAAVAEHCGKPVHNIFIEKGEKEFRTLEVVVIDSLLRKNYSVLSLGGGAITNSVVRTRLWEANAKVIWLRAGPEELYQRIQQDERSKRPDLTLTGGLEEVKSVLKQREVFYVKCANLAVDTDARQPAAVAAEIVSWWRELVSGLARND